MRLYGLATRMFTAFVGVAADVAVGDDAATVAVGEVVPPLPPQVVASSSATSERTTRPLAVGR